MPAASKPPPSTVSPPSPAPRDDTSPNEGQQLAGNDRYLQDRIVHDEAWDRHGSALKPPPQREQRLIFGRLEQGHSFRQLAAIDGTAGPDRARMALKRGRCGSRRKWAMTT